MDIDIVHTGPFPDERNEKLALDQQLHTAVQMVVKLTLQPTHTLLFLAIPGPPPPTAATISPPVDLRCASSLWHSDPHYSRLCKTTRVVVVEGGRHGNSHVRNHVRRYCCQRWSAGNRDGRGRKFQT